MSVSLTKCSHPINDSNYRPNVLAQSMDYRLHADSSQPDDMREASVKNHCSVLKKGVKIDHSSGPQRVTITSLDDPAILTPVNVLDSDGNLLNSYTTYCGYTSKLNIGSYQPSAICCKSDYPQPTDSNYDDAITKCCFGQEKPENCPADYCSDLDGKTKSCQEFMLKKAQSNPAFAQTYYKELKLAFPDKFKDSLTQLCLHDDNHTQNLQSEVCQNFCKDVSYNTPNGSSICTDTIKLYCKDKKPDFQNLSNPDNKICGCYYGDENIYTNYYNNISKDLNVTAGILDPKKQCFYPLCENADYLPSDTSCKPVIITECIQNVNFNNDGTINGNINIKENVKECIAKVTENKGGESNDGNKTGDDGNKTGDDGNKTGDDGNKTGDDGNKTGDDGSKIPFYKTRLGIGLIVGGSVLFLIIIILIIYNMRKKDESEYDQDYIPQQQYIPPQQQYIPPQQQYIPQQQQYM
jgi:hypothetical protein